MWYRELQIAIIEKDTQKIGELVNSMPHFKTIDEMSRAQHLLVEAGSLIDTLREEAALTMKQLKKHIDFLKSTQDSAPNKLDLRS